MVTSPKQLYGFYTGNKLQMTDMCSVGQSHEASRGLGTEGCLPYGDSKGESTPGDKLKLNLVLVTKEAKFANFGGGGDLTLLVSSFCP